jgi:MFS family permease
MASFDSSAARGLVAQGPWRRWAAVASLARLPAAMAPFSLLLVGRGATGSYADGAWLVSAYALGSAAAAPLRGRALDRAGLPAALGRVLTYEALVLGALGAAVLLRAPFALLLGLSLAFGVVPAGVSGGVRAALASIAGERSLESAFALDAAMFELLWVVGPLLVGLTAALGAPLASLGLMASSALAAAALAGRLPGRSAAPSPPSRGGLWRLSGATSVFGVALCLGVNWGALEAGLPPRLEQLGAGAAFWSVLSALLAVSSTCGGLACAVAPPAEGEGAVRRRTIVLATLWACLLLPTVWVARPAAFVAWSLSAGFVLAPLSAQLTSALQRALPPSHQAEGFALYGACWSAGMAAGTAIAGRVLGRSGPATLLAIAALLPFAAALVAAAPCLRRPARRPPAGVGPLARRRGL